MVPCNNPEEFIIKHGHWWYLREFDFLPEPLEFYDGYLSRESMELIYGSQFSYKKWALFTTLKEARKASNNVRKILGLDELFVGEDLEPVWTEKGEVLKLSELKKAMNEIKETIKDGD